MDHARAEIPRSEFRVYAVSRPSFTCPGKRLEKLYAAPCAFYKNPAPNENNPLSPPKRGAGLGFVLVNIGSLTPAPQRGVAPTGLYALSSFEGGEGE